MLAEEINQVFDQALALKPGQFIRIACASRSDQDSTRAQLYRVRKNYLATQTRPTAISISRFTDKSADVATLQPKFYVLIRRESAQRVEMVDPDGTVTPIVTTHNVEKDTNSYDERIVAAMKADGFSDEEIEAYFNDADDQEETSNESKQS